MTDKEKLLEKTMKNTRSVLLPNREGLLSDAFEKEFRGHFGFPFPYERLGFVSAMELIEYMYHQDVVSVDRLPSGHILLKGIPDKNTEHVSRMVKNQRRNEEGYNRRTAQIIRQQGPGFRKHIERSQVTEAAREVPKHTKAVVEDMMLEHEDGLAVADFCRAFHEKEGYRIEFMSWGFLNLEDFLYYGLGDIVDLSPVDGHYGIEWILFPKHHAGRTPPKLDNQSNSKDKLCVSDLVSDQMKSEFWAILKVHPEGITSNKFAGEYQKMCGSNLVPQKFGYQTLVEMCQWLPDIFEIVRDGSVWRFKAREKEMKKEEKINEKSKEKVCVSDLVSDQMKTKFSAVQTDGLTADKFADEYHKLYGSELDPQQFGCQTVLEMCLWLPDIFEVVRDGGVWRFKAREEEIKKEERIATADQKVISADSVEKCNLIFTENIKSNIKRVLMKHPHGVAYQKFRRAYLDTIGNNLEVKTLESFFNSPGISDMVQLKQGAGKVVVMPSNILPHSDKRKDVMGSRNELIQQELPSDRRVGDFIEVIVTEVVSPHRFWIRLNGNTSEAMDYLVDRMDTFYYSGKSKEYKIPDEEVTAGLLCASLFVDGTWHRASITEIVDENHVEVFFVDYGTAAKVRMEALRYLTKNFGELPSQAIQSRLAGVKPAGGMARFSKDASGRFLQLIKSSPEGGRVVAAIGEIKPKLILWLMDSRHVKGGLPVSQILVEEGLVEVDDQTMGHQVKIVETKRDHITKLLNEP